MRKSVVHTVVASLLFVVSLTSCYKIDLDNISDEISWKPDISIPLGETTATTKGNLSDPDKKVLTDSITFKLSDIISERGQVDSLILRLNIENEFPIVWNMYVYSQNVQPNHLLYGPKKISAGKIDTDTGESTIPNKMSPENIPLNSEQIDFLYLSDVLVIKFEYLKAVEPPHDDIEYQLKTQIGLQAKLNMAYE